MSVALNRQRTYAILQVFAVAGAYIAISTAAARGLDASFLFPADWSSVERATGSGFLIGAIVQLALVLLAAYLLRSKELRTAIAASVAPSTPQAWLVAAIATAIHVGTALLVYLPQPGRVLDASGLNLILSFAAAPDGWTQEVMFRGYVLFRLSRAKVFPLAQVLVSGALFSAIHFGYTGNTAWQFLSPLVGTFTLGCFYAWAVQIGRGSLKPVICCHVLIILITQPWLALAR